MNEASLSPTRNAEVSRFYKVFERQTAMNFSVIYCELCSGQQVRFGSCLGEKLATRKEGQAAERRDNSQKQAAGSSVLMASPSPEWPTVPLWGTAVGSTLLGRTSNSAGRSSTDDNPSPAPLG